MKNVITVIFYSSNTYVFYMNIEYAQYHTEFLWNYRRER